VRSWLAAIAASTLVAGCTLGGPSRPEAGPGGGPVTVAVSDEPEPGANLLLDLSADDAEVGSACVTADEWDDGAWVARWWWSRTSATPEPIRAGDQATCPAIGVPLPTRMAIDLPPTLPAGSWRIAWMAGDDLGAYLFDVG
jgi:hypothetical protein